MDIMIAPRASLHVSSCYVLGPMSLGIVFKGPEGIVLAVDSRVTLFNETKNPGGKDVMIPATYDNAQKLLKVQGQDIVGAVTFGVGAFGAKEPRTAHSYLPELESELLKAAGGDKPKRLSVEDFAKKLSEFFLRQWNESGMTVPFDGDMFFYVGGYDQNSPHGRVFEIRIPNQAAPKEHMASPYFGVIWGGQHEFVERLITGVDPNIAAAVHEFLKTPAATRNDQALKDHLRDKFQVAIPWQFLPLQDCVDLAIFMVRTTITLQRWTVGVRGVGGAIDVATITRADGFKPIQRKSVTGDVRRSDL
jgi:hypothetical protein